LAVAILRERAGNKQSRTSLVNKRGYFSYNTATGTAVPHNLEYDMNTARHFRHLLETRWGEEKFLCVGLDPIEGRILKASQLGGPRHEQFVLTFLEGIVDATKDVAAAFKPNRAFFRGAKGAEALKKLIEHIQMEAPDVPVILDCKVGDIGNSNEGYIAEMFDYFGADAITVHGYLGCGTWGKALEREDKGLFFLCRTSNPEAADLQDRPTLVRMHEAVELTGLSANDVRRLFNGHPESNEVAMPVYQYVALKVAAQSPESGLVVGATAPEQLEQVRQLAPNVPLLIPGIGKQGGQIEAVIRAAKTRFIINSSSDILYAFEQRGGKPDQAANAKAHELHDQIIANQGVLV
jgi:orotidine-5'-phosphate decarboxylase